MHWRNQRNVHEIFLHVNGQAVSLKCQGKMDKNLVFLWVFYTGSLDFFTLFLFVSGAAGNTNLPGCFLSTTGTKLTISSEIGRVLTMSTLSVKGKESERGTLFIYRAHLYHCVPAYSVFVLLHLKHLCLKRYENAIGKMETQSTEDSQEIFQNK